MSTEKSTLIGAAVSLALANMRRLHSPEQRRLHRAKRSKTVVVTGIRASLRESLEVKRRVPGRR